MKIKYTEDERIAEIEKIKGWLSELKEKKVYCVLRNVSRSGMSRDIDFYLFMPDGTKLYLSYAIAGLLDYPFNDNKGVKVSGCGMDMGFSVVYGLGRCLFPNGDGETITGRNGDKEAEKDGGYLIKHEWI